MIVVRRVDDFGFPGGSVWAVTDRHTVPPVDGPGRHHTDVRCVYSSNGLYVHFDCDDDRLSCTWLPDHADLWNEDVVEAFFWTDDRRPVYFEYELSPLGAELPLLVSNDNGTFMGWSPWHYEGDRRVRKATAVRGGPAEPGASVTGWSAEFFVPFALLRGLGNVPPVPGTRWRANFCRIDYDGPARTLYSWSPGITDSFHAIDRFGTLVFE